MKKIRKILYNYVFRRVIAWHEGRFDDQELTDALYSYDIYYKPHKRGSLNMEPDCFANEKEVDK